MARLINADVAEKLLREYADDVGCNRGEYEMANGILKAVSYIRHNIPTAYDVEKVVERFDSHHRDYYYDEAIDIVEEGWVYEQKRNNNVPGGPSEKRDIESKR